MKETQLNKTQNVSSGINFKLLNKEMAVKERKKKKKLLWKKPLKTYSNEHTFSQMCTFNIMLNQPKLLATLKKMQSLHYKFD